MIPASQSPSVAVIDVGSNTIKALVANRADGAFQIIWEHTLESRISRGLYDRSPPVLTDTAMDAAVDSLRILIEKMNAFSPSVVEIVGTSALRDAVNRKVFRTTVEEKFGLPLRILSGAEEAEDIARGLLEEPGLSPETNFLLSDLGGGSLELVAAKYGKVTRSESLDLGAVRLLHHFHPQADQPITATARTSLKNHCLEAFAKHDIGQGFQQYWGTGGAFTVTRAILAAENRIPFEKQSNRIPLSEIQRLEQELGALPVAKRARHPGLPESRADIFPVALVILASLGEYTQAEVFHHSFYNLRVGRATRLLDQFS